VVDFPTPPLPSTTIRRRSKSWVSIARRMPDEVGPAAAILPAQKICAPGEAAATSVEHHQVAVVDPPLLERLVERDWNRGGRSVAVAIHVDEDLIGRYAEAFGDRVDDSSIGLMTDHQVHVGERDARAGRHLAADFFHALYGDFEELRSLHLDRVLGLPPD